MHEAAYCESVFATFTYNDEALPKNNSLDKDEFRRMLKRLRKAIEPRKVRYFGAGEYGDKLGRPHYHAILFGIARKELKLDRFKIDHSILEQAWSENVGSNKVPIYKSKGNVFVGDVTFESARYVSGYITEKYIGKMLYKYGGRVPPFQLQSQGLGKEFVDRNDRYLLDNLGCTIRGVSVGLPRYYRKRLEIPKEVIAKKAEEMREEIHRILAGRVGPDLDLAADYLSGSRVQKAQDLKAKIFLLKQRKL